MKIELFKENDLYDESFEHLDGSYRTSYDITDYSLEINKADKEKGISSSADLSFSTQDILEEAFIIFNEFQTETLYFRHFSKDNIFIDLSNVEFPKSVKHIEIDFYDSKKCKVDLLSKTRQVLENIRVFKLKAKYAYEFNQFYAMPNLKQLCISYNKKSLGWLEHDGIIDLRIDGFKEDNLQSLSKMKSLTRLSLFGGSIKSLDGIENLTNLEALTIFNTRSLTSIEALAKSTSIVSVEVERHKKITDWRCLKDMEQLRWLNVPVADDLTFALEKPNLIVWGKIVYKQGIEDVFLKRYESLSKEERDKIQFNFYNGFTRNYYED